MADANGIIFRNPTLGAWFVGPTVDLTAWNVITVTGCPDTAFNLDYTYAPATGRWTNGTRDIWKSTLWYMSDGTITYSAADNGLNIPPSTFSRPMTDATFENIVSATLSGAGASDANGEYSKGGIPEAPEYLAKGTIEAPYAIVNEFDEGWYWHLNDIAGEIYRTARNEESNYPLPTIGWTSRLPEFDPVPTFEYTLGSYTATVSPTSSTATWASASPTSGFVSLTDTPDADFGYVITLDVQGGTAYPYYKYCTKGVSEVYGTLPTPVRENHVFAGWYSLPDGQGTRVEAATALLEADDHTLYARWVANVSGPIHNASGLFAYFTISIGTDVFVEPIAPNYGISVAVNVTQPIPVTVVAP